MVILSVGPAVEVATQFLSSSRGFQREAREAREARARAAMGLVCTQCGVRFYLPPGEQTWLEKRCGIRTPALPQFCIRCMEKRFARPVPKSEEARSRDGSTRLPSGQKMFPLLWAQEKVVYQGVRLKKPVALLGSDTAGIQFQRDKPGRTFFGRTAEEIPRGATTVSLEDSRSAKEEMLNGLESGVPLSGVLITIQHATRKVITFDASRHTVTLERGFATKLSSNTAYYIFQSFSGSTFPEPLCSNDSIAKERERESRAKAAALSKAKRAAQSVRTVQQQTILADIWGPPCKIESLGTNWNVELLTGPQKRLRSNCLNYVNALVTSAESGALVDHSETIRHARTLAFCMGELKVNLPSMLSSTKFCPNQATTAVAAKRACSLRFRKTRQSCKKSSEWPTPRLRSRDCQSGNGTSKPLRVSHGWCICLLQCVWPNTLQASWN